jgi:hypothetical protein
MGHDTQDAPKSSQSVRYVRVIRACHPLVGQVVKVLRQTRHVGHEEPRWVVQPPGRSAVSLPLSWAVQIDDTTDPVPCPVEPLDNGPCVDVTTLRNLATMVSRLRANPPQEVEPHEQPVASDASDPPGSQSAASLEPTAPGAPPRADRHLGGDDPQAAPTPPECAERGLR